MHVFVCAMKELSCSGVAIVHILDAISAVTAHSLGQLVNNEPAATTVATSTQTSSLLPQQLKSTQPRLQAATVHSLASQVATVHSLASQVATVHSLASQAATVHSLVYRQLQYTAWFTDSYSTQPGLLTATVHNLASQVATIHNLNINDLA